MSFKNVTWNGCVGNLEIVGEKIIFCDDEKSVNDTCCKIEISINEIDKEKLKKYLLYTKDLSTVEIETTTGEYRFIFGHDDVYKEFIGLIQAETLL